MWWVFLLGVVWCLVVGLVVVRRVRRGVVPPRSIRLCVLLRRSRGLVGRCLRRGFERGGPLAGRCGTRTRSRRVLSAEILTGDWRSYCPWCWCGWACVAVFPWWSGGVWLGVGLVVGVAFWRDSETTPLRSSRKGDARRSVCQNPSQNIICILEVMRQFLRQFWGGNRTCGSHRVPAGQLPCAGHSTAARRADRSGSPEVLRGQDLQPQD